MGPHSSMAALDSIQDVLSQPPAHDWKEHEKLEWTFLQTRLTALKERSKMSAFALTCFQGLPRRVRVGGDDMRRQPLPRPKERKFRGPRIVHEPHARNQERRSEGGKRVRPVSAVARLSGASKC